MIRDSRLLRGVTTILALVVSAGCYSYAPIERPAPGTTVRIQVPLRSAVQNPNQAPESISLEGVVLATPGDSLVLTTQTRRELGQFRILTETDTLRVARSGLLAVEEQIYSRPKTYALTALVTGGAVGLLVLALDAAGGQAGDGGGGGPPTNTALRIPGVVFQHLWNALIR